MAKKVTVDSFEDYDYSLLCQYAGIDNVVTSELLARLWPLVTKKPAYQWVSEGKVTSIQAPSVWSEHQNVKMPALDFIIDMQANGILYDVPANRRMDRAMRDRMANLEDIIFPAIGKSPSTFNLGSDLDLGTFLYRERGFTPEVFTKRGQPAVSGDAIKALIKQRPDDERWLKAILERNDLTSVHGSFIGTYVEDWVKRDGRIHPSYNLHGTSSHRISSSDPNLLNLPNPLHGFNVRSLYIVPKGKVFITFDFSSCEVKILAALCGDETMLKAILSGLDFHSYTASMMYNISYDEFVGHLKGDDAAVAAKFKAMRQGAKAITFNEPEACYRKVA